VNTDSGELLINVHRHLDGGELAGLAEHGEERP
jgi:hypothetical protein